MLHSKGIKCVVFVADRHILKLSERTQPVNFTDYRVLRDLNQSGAASFTVRVYAGRCVESAIPKASSAGEFMVHRTGLYVYGDDPMELLKRYVFFYFGTSF